MSVGGINILEKTGTLMSQCILLTGNLNGLVNDSVTFVKFVDSYSRSLLANAANWPDGVC